ncbi:hypothetical protein COOONC_07816 [Cooperia oncophora]
MGASQSTNRAAKFSGSRRRVQSCNSAPPTAPTVRRQLSQRNTNRNVKEFSKFWSDGYLTTDYYRWFVPSKKWLPTTKRVSETSQQRTPDKSDDVECFRSFKFSAVEQPPQNAITPLPTPYITPRSPRNSQQLLTRQRQSRSFSQFGAYAMPSVRYDHFDDDVISESKSPHLGECNAEQPHTLQFPHETAIY